MEMGVPGHIQIDHLFGKLSLPFLTKHDIIACFRCMEVLRQIGMFPVTPLSERKFMNMAISSNIHHLFALACFPGEASQR